MKILISESQYNRSIDSYLTYIFEPHEVFDKTKKRNKGIEDHIVWYKHDIPIVEITITEKYQKSQIVWVQKKIWEDISRMFSLDNDGTQTIIENWFKLNYGFNNIVECWYDTLYGFIPRD